MVLFTLRMAGMITALKAQAHNKERVSVYLDGEFAFGLALIHALWLKVGQFLSDEEIAQLQSADTLEQAADRAVNFVAYRPRSVAEVRRRLKQANVHADTIEQVIERLVNAGLLDDSSFSKAWTESRLRSNPRSKRMIAWELRQKGVDPKTVSKTLAEVSDETSALDAALKRMPRLAGLPTHEQKRKLITYLAGKGFDFETAEEAADKALLGSS
jgi:regulatory protein